MQSLNIVFLFLAVCVTAILAQSGPTPPRLNIPGAIPLSLKPQFRNDKLVRIRRPIAGARPAPIPNAIPIPVTPRLLEEAKPVTEEPEDETPDNYLPQFNTHPLPNRVLWPRCLLSPISYSKKARPRSHDSNHKKDHSHPK